MFNRLFGRRPQQQLHGIQESLPDLINVSGRMSFEILQGLVAEMDQAAFVKFMQRPVLAGAAVKAGSVSQRAATDQPRIRKRTMLFKPADYLTAGGAAAEEKTGDSLQRAVYPLLKISSSNARENNIFTIGRVAGCDLVMPDFAISEQHARIELRDADFYVSDLASTNGTRLNGFPVGKVKLALNDKDEISFARYDFCFLTPASFYELLTGIKSAR